MLVSARMGDEKKGNRKCPPALKTTAHQINPDVGTHPLHLLLSLRHPQRLVQNRLARLTIIHHFDYPLHHGETTSVGISHKGDAPAADEDSASVCRHSRKRGRLSHVVEIENGLVGGQGGPILT